MAMYSDRRPISANGYNSGDEEGPNYMVEHLATFTVSKQNEIMYPADGMRRLLQMEKSSGIWTQKMIMRLEREEVTIVDYENGEIVEKFPISRIRDPTAFTSKDPKDMYNNIFIFVVMEDHMNRFPPEMHIFQCVGISALDVVEDFKMYMMGNVRPGAARIPPPPNKPPPEPPMNGVNSYFGHRSGLNDDASSTSSERYEKDVNVLNRCFDDIEKFIARLQHAAAASRELERRHKSRKSKKKEQGDGLLSARAKPPTEVEYVDIFQKFKLSFILLAKLKAHIHDPNAPELVHFLFSPLTLIVEASNDSAIPPNLPSRVIAPLLTAEAIDLLANCLSSKETELWNSLGDAWRTPKDKWNGHVLPYVPVFSDGWTPDPSYFNEESELRNREDSRYSSDYYYDSDHANSMTRRDARSDISNDSIEKNGDSAARFEQQQRRWLAELKARNAKIVQVTYPRTANNDKELTVVRGEYLEVLDSSRKWWRARNMRNQVGHVPNTIVTSLLQDDEVFTPPPAPKGRSNKKETSSSEDEDGLPVRRKVERSESVSTIPPPPPPMPTEKKTEPAKPTTIIKPIQRTPSQTDLMVDELKDVLTMFRNQRRDLDIRKTPEVYINRKSTPNEVLAWLKAKEFDVVVQKRLKGMNGEEVFELRRTDLVKYFGKEEGNRLDSQLTIQRNCCDYKTARSSELKAFLAKARERAEAKQANYAAAAFKATPEKKAGSQKPMDSIIIESKQSSPESSPDPVPKKKPSPPAPAPAPPPPPPSNKTVPKKSSNKHEMSYDSDDDMVPTGTLRDIIRKQKRKMALDEN